MTKPVRFRTAIALLMMAPLVGYAVGAVSDVVRGGKPPEAIESVVLRKPVPMASFALVDQDGRSLGLDSLKGHWTMVVLGYTSCPDVCPFTLANLAHVLAAMARAAPDRDLPGVVFVSVDPERDRPEDLKRYVASFDPAFKAATGPRSQLDVFVRQIGATYRYGAKDADGFYAVDHSAEIYLFDPSARLYARLQPPLDASRVTRIFRALTEYYVAADQRN